MRSAKEGHSGLEMRLGAKGSVPTIKLMEDICMVTGLHICAATHVVSDEVEEDPTDTAREAKTETHLCPQDRVAFGL